MVGLLVAAKEVFNCDGGHARYGIMKFGRKRVDIRHFDRDQFMKSDTIALT
jgi:hypothetical protein